MKSLMTLVSLTAALTFSGTTNARPYDNELTGALAKDIYLMAESTDAPGAPGPRTTDVTCAYEKKMDAFQMVLCINNEGYLNPPLNDQIAQFMLENRQPQLLEEPMYTIGVRANCTAEGEVYRCRLEDLEGQ